MSDQLRQKRTFVSFDLGSESSTAFWQSEHGPEQVNLQFRAPQLERNAPIYFRNPDGNVSKRLRTRFWLFDETPGVDCVDADGKWYDWGADHACLSFAHDGSVDQAAYRRSVFRFFFEGGREILGYPLAPNPKIPFQFGARDVLPSLRKAPPSTESYRPRPKDVILHVCTQILNNFVLRSPELSSVDRSSIHLVLSIPNVYSVTHREILRKFLCTNIKLREDRLDLVYESDAAAFYALHLLSRAANFGKEANDIPASVLRTWRAARSGARVLTFDIGKGTTDVSLVEARAIEENGIETLEYTIIARTGRCGGGGELTFILARYFNERFVQLKPILDHYGPWSWADLLHCLNKEGRPAAGQGYAIQALEEMIEELKRCFTDTFLIKESPRLREARNTLVSTILGFFERGIDQRLQPAEPKEEALQLIRDKLTDAFTLPSELPTTSTGGQAVLERLRSHSGQVVRALRGAFAPASEDALPPIVKLTRDIEHHVNDTVSLFDLVLETVRQEEGQPAARLDDTFVLIAGQASQFSPLRTRLAAKFNAHNLPIWDLKGDEAKNACALGALLYPRIRAKIVNAEKIHGGYFFAPLVALGGSGFLRVDMVKLLEGNDVFVRCANDQNHELFYTLVPWSDSPSLQRVRAEATRVGEYQPLLQTDPDGVEGLYIKLRWNLRNRELFINDFAQDVHSYGTVQSDIFAKVWPDFLPYGAPLDEQNTI